MYLYIRMFVCTYRYACIHSLLHAQHYLTYVQQLTISIMVLVKIALFISHPIRVGLLLII